MKLSAGTDTGLHEFMRPFDPYRCPGCDSRTCSAECYGKHKLYTRCKGKRDPTAGLSPHELRSASYFDRDYNYLANVERAIFSGRRKYEQKCSDNYKKWISTSGNLSLKNAGAGPAIFAGEPNMGLTRSRTVKEGYHALPHREKLLFRQAQERNLSIKFTPEGLTRQRLNETRVKFAKRKNGGSKTLSSQQPKIEWTVEWIFSLKFKCFSKVDEDDTLDGALNKMINIHVKKLSSTLQQVPNTNGTEWSVLFQKLCISHSHGSCDAQLSTPNISLFLDLPCEPRDNHGRKAVYWIACLLSTLKSVLKGKTIIDFPTIHILENETDDNFSRIYYNVSLNANTGSRASQTTAALDNNDEHENCNSDVHAQM